MVRTFTAWFETTETTDQVLSAFGAGLVVQYRAGEVVNDQATLGSPVPLDESLSDVSDTEINALLLSEDERQAKALMWYASLFFLPHSDINDILLTVLCFRNFFRDELMKDVMPEVHRRWKMQKRKEVLDVSSSAKRLKYVCVGVYCNEENVFYIFCFTQTLGE